MTLDSTTTADAVNVGVLKYNCDDTYQIWQQEQQQEQQQQQYGDTIPVSPQLSPCSLLEQLWATSKNLRKVNRTKSSRKITVPKLRVILTPPRLKPERKGWKEL
eukprot:14120015-Ditylum_brightwellii.AAC.1